MILLRPLGPLIAVALLVAAGCSDQGLSDAAAPEGPDHGNCADGADNDRDGLFDCADPDCASADDCAPVDDDDAIDDDDDEPEDDDITPDDDDSAVPDDDDSAGDDDDSSAVDDDDATPVEPPGIVDVLPEYVCPMSAGVLMPDFLDCPQEALSLPAVGQGYLDVGFGWSLTPLCGGQVLVSDVVALELRRVDVFTGAILDSFPLPAWPTRTALNCLDGTVFLSHASEGQVTRVDAVGGGVTTFPAGTWPWDLTLVEPDRLLVKADQLLLLDAANGAFVASSSAWGMEDFLVFDPVHDRLFSASGGGSPSNLVRFDYDPVTEELAQMDEYLYLGGAGEDLAVSPDGARVAYVTATGNYNASRSIWDFDAADLSVQHGEWSVSSVSFLRGAAFSPDGEHLLIGTTGGLELHGVDSHVQVASWPTVYPDCDEDSLHSVGVSPGGSVMYAAQTCDTGTRIIWAVWDPDAP